MSGSLSLQSLERLIANGEVDTVVCAFTDMQGRLVGKRCTGRWFIEAAAKEWHACDYLLTADIEMEPVPGFKSASWDKGYGDFVIKPDLATLRRLPWLPGTALVLGDVVDHEGRPIPTSPRAILKRQLERLGGRGLGAKMASELEFYVFEDDFRSAHAKRYHGLTPAGWYIEDYHIFETTKREPLMRAIRNGLDGADIPVQESKGEWGPGQAELNLVYAEALEMADRHVIFKNAVKEIAFAQNKSVTFMAKWQSDLAGNSCHIHLSLWGQKDSKAIFAKADEPRFAQALGGMLALAPALTLFLAPTVNSYKRFQPGTFAPTRLVWSDDNRTAAFRTLGHGASRRIECRLPGADVNPYLAYAALLAAAQHGIEQRLDPGEPLLGNAYEAQGSEQLPLDLHQAIQRLEACESLREALGEEVVEHYLHAARWEWQRYEAAVTDWELLRYFERG